MDERDLDPDPLRQFERWFAEAREAGLAVPEAMALATATPDGRPSVRMVLLKGPTSAASPSTRTTRAGRAASSTRTRRRRSSSTGSRSAGRCGSRASRPRRRRGVGGVLPHAAARQPPRRLGLAAEPAARRPRRARAPLRRGAEERFGEDVPLPPHWGGFRLVPGRVRVLAAPRRPAARPRPLRARRRSAGQRERLAP